VTTAGTRRTRNYGRISSKCKSFFAYPKRLG